MRLRAPGAALGTRARPARQLSHAALAHSSTRSSEDLNPARGWHPDKELGWVVRWGLCLVELVLRGFSSSGSQLRAQCTIIQPSMGSRRIRTASQEGMRAGAWEQPCQGTKCLPF